MGKLIIDKVTGTVLNIEGCYVIEAEQLDDNFTDSEIAELANRVGVPVSEYKVTVETMREHEGIDLFHQLCGKFEWKGCIFTEGDIRQNLEDEDIDEATLNKMVEKVQWTHWWRKIMDNSIIEAGYAILDEAIYEVKNEMEKEQNNDHTN
jgi:hypothetical protein